MRALPEIDVGGGFDTICPAAVVNKIQVHFQNLVFSELLFHIDSQNGFPDFTDDSLFRREVGKLYQLLAKSACALLKSAGNKSAAEYETLIEEFAKDLDIRAEIIRGKLAGFETVSERVRVDEIKGEINTFQTDYDYHISMIRDISNKIQERKYVLAGLECAINDRSEDSELMGYFICNKNLILISVNGTSIVFIAHGYADVYDQDAFEQYVGNHRGYMYDNIDSAAGKVQLEKLYRAVFSEGKYKLRVCAAYTADMPYALIRRCCHIDPYGVFENFCNLL